MIAAVLLAVMVLAMPVAITVMTAAMCQRRNGGDGKNRHRGEQNA